MLYEDCLKKYTGAIDILTIPSIEYIPSSGSTDLTIPSRGHVISLRAKMAQVSFNDPPLFGNENKIAYQIGEEVLQKATVILSWKPQGETTEKYAVGTIYMAKTVDVQADPSTGHEKCYIRSFIVTSSRINVQMSQQVFVRSPWYHVSGVADVVEKSKVGRDGCLTVLLADRLSFDDRYDQVGNLKPPAYDRRGKEIIRKHDRDLVLGTFPPLIPKFYDREPAYMGFTAALDDNGHPKYPYDLSQQAVHTTDEGEFQAINPDCLRVFPPLPTIHGRAALPPRRWQGLGYRARSLGFAGSDSGEQQETREGKGQGAANEIGCLSV